MAPLHRLTSFAADRNCAVWDHIDNMVPRKRTSSPGRPGDIRRLGEPFALLLRSEARANVPALAALLCTAGADEIFNLPSA